MAGMMRLQTGPGRDALRNVGIKANGHDVWVNGNGETGPLDELTANALMVQGGWIDVSPDDDLPHADAHPDDDESLRPRRRGRKAKAEAEAGASEGEP